MVELPVDVLLTYHQTPLMGAPVTVAVNCLFAPGATLAAIAETWVPCPLSSSAPSLVAMSVA